MTIRINETNLRTTGWAKIVFILWEQSRS